jgi:hypothetical protein
MDQAVHPPVELGERYSLLTAYKGLSAGMQKGISVNDISKGSYIVAAQFF